MRVGNVSVETLSSRVQEVMFSFETLSSRVQEVVNFGELGCSWVVEVSFSAHFEGSLTEEDADSSETLPSWGSEGSDYAEF